MVSPSLIGHRVYIDSSALIYAVEVPHLYPGLRTKLFEPFAQGQLTLVTSWVTYTEVMVHPVRLGDPILETTYRQLFQPSPVFEILRVDQQIADQAARIRATHGFKLPDAIHIATGLSAHCTRFVTGDVRWSQAGLTVIDAGRM